MPRGDELCDVGDNFLEPLTHRRFGGIRVAHEDDQSPATVAIRAHNEAVSADPDFIATIVPTRDGVMTALRLR